MRWDEGFLISKAAVTIAVANRIITNSLRDQGFFDQAVAAETVREELHRMARNSVATPKRMRDIRSKAVKQKGRSKHTARLQARGRPQAPHA